LSINRHLSSLRGDIHTLRGISPSFMPSGGFDGRRRRGRTLLYRRHGARNHRTRERRHRLVWRLSSETLDECEAGQSTDDENCKRNAHCDPDLFAIPFVCFIVEVYFGRNR
ncbi:hypothetical protein PENTCL1PPCAC_21834, partial [Pristionchus entomophagus]